MILASEETILTWEDHFSIWISSAGEILMYFINIVNGGNGIVNNNSSPARILPWDSKSPPPKKNQRGWNKY